MAVNFRNGFSQPLFLYFLTSSRSITVQRLVAVAPALVEQLVLLGGDPEKTLELICKVVVVAEAELIGDFA